ncbi:hypothetical protein JCM10908_002224 [Rhodotorula pacifica]|uniref:uncharacterized protein n=1 Tax=Rhodotorula pacifica TaxID=1495444 RepID=UPI0031734EAD
MSDTTRSDASAKPCYIARLPDEVKTLIARCCKEQDDRWCKVYFDNSRSARREPAKRLAKFQESLPTSTLGALFRTSREWARLVAPFRFKRICPSTKLTDPRFRMNILRRRGELFTELYWGGAYTSEWEAIANVLPALPNLKHLVINNSLANHFLTFYDENHEDDTGRLRKKWPEHLAIQEAVTDLFLGADDITLGGIWLLTSCLMLTGCIARAGKKSAATKLRLAGNDFSSLTMFNKVAECAPNLHDLALAVYSFADWDRHPSSEAGLDVVPFPKLARLDVSANECTYPHSFTSFLDAHSSTLDTLIVKQDGATRSDPFFIPPQDATYLGLSPFQAVYPELRHLHLELIPLPTTGAGQAFLDSLTPERFPRLETLFIDPRGVFGPDVNYAKHLAAFTARPGFRLELVGDGPPEPFLEESLLLDCRWPKPDDPYFEDDVNRDGTAITREQHYLTTLEIYEESCEAGGDICKELEETAQFLSERIELAKITGDTRAIGRLAEAVQGVVMERLFMEA